MKEYEVMREIYNSCAGKWELDNAFTREIETDDIEKEGPRRRRGPLAAPRRSGLHKISGGFWAPGRIFRKPLDASGAAAYAGIERVSAPKGVPL